MPWVGRLVGWSDMSDQPQTHANSIVVMHSKARFPFKRNRLSCVRTALRALRKRKPQETQALALASSQSWLPLLRPSIPIAWRLRLLRENFMETGLKSNWVCYAQNASENTEDIKRTTSGDYNYANES